MATTGHESAESEHSENITAEHIFDAGDGHYTVFHPGTSEVYYVHLNPSWEDWPVVTASGELSRDPEAIDALRAAVRTAPSQRSALEMEYDHLRALERRALDVIQGAQVPAQPAQANGAGDTSSGSSGGDSGTSGGSDDEEASPISALPSDHEYDTTAHIEAAREFFEKWSGVKSDLHPDWISIEPAQATVPENFSSPHAGETVDGLHIEHAPPWETGAWDSSGDGGWVSDAKKKEFKDSQTAFSEVMQDPEEVIWFGDPHYTNFVAFSDADSVF